MFVCVWGGGGSSPSVGPASNKNYLWKEKKSLAAQFDNSVVIKKKGVDELLLLTQMKSFVLWAKVVFTKINDLYFFRFEITPLFVA